MSTGISLALERGEVQAMFGDDLDYNHIAWHENRLEYRIEQPHADPVASSQSRPSARGRPEKSKWHRPRAN